MNVLIVGPLPPPYTGNSRPFMNLKEFFEGKGLIPLTVNTSEIYSSSTFFKVFWWLRKIFEVSRVKESMVYYSLAESIGGVLRDYLMIRLLSRNGNSVFIHLLGGNNFSRLSKSWARPLIKSYVTGCKGAVVEGETQAEIFHGLSQKNVLINYNYVDNIPITAEQKINYWKTSKSLKVLFLSNMLPGKGWHEVYEAAKLVVSRDIEFTFAGNAEPSFIRRLEESPNCKYEGFVNGDLKDALFTDSHIFIMPTYYEYEGQPFSIVEAMSFGCIIGTTYHSGIVDIFTDTINGKRLLKYDSQGIADWLSDLCDNSDNVELMITNNIHQAKQKHMFDKWIRNIENFLEL